MAAFLYVRSGRAVGASSGRLYGLNTFGAIVGAAGTTALLIPWIGVKHSIVLLALLAGGERWTGWPRRVLTAAALGLLIVLARGLNRWLTLTDIYAKQEPGNLLAVHEGAGATITVHERGPTERVISINGVNVAGTNPVLRRSQKLQAHLPACLHPSPKSVLQIGFGSGGTCYSLSPHSFQSVLPHVQVW